MGDMAPPGAGFLPLRRPRIPTPTGGSWTAWSATAPGGALLECDNEPSNVGLTWAGTAAEYVAQLQVMHRAVRTLTPTRRWRWAARPTRCRSPPTRAERSSRGPQSTTTAATGPIPANADAGSFQPTRAG
jgi:hypothetical protein